MRLYHRTSAAAAAAILAEGFRKSEYQIEDENGELSGGVWLCTPPYDPASLGSLKGDGVILAVSIPDDELEAWEWREDPKDSIPVPAWIKNPYREFYVPADIVNRYGPPEVIDEYEEFDDR